MRGRARGCAPAVLGAGDAAGVGLEQPQELAWQDEEGALPSVLRAGPCPCSPDPLHHRFHPATYPPPGGSRQSWSPRPKSRPPRGAQLPTATPSGLGPSLLCPRTLQPLLGAGAMLAGSAGLVLPQQHLQHPHLHPCRCPALWFFGRGERASSLLVLRAEGAGAHCGVSPGRQSAGTWGRAGARSPLPEVPAATLGAQCRALVVLEPCASQADALVCQVPKPGADSSASTASPGVPLPGFAGLTSEVLQGLCGARGPAEAPLAAHRGWDVPGGALPRTWAPSPGPWPCSHAEAARGQSGCPQLQGGCVLRALLPSRPVLRSPLWTAWRG